MIRRFHKGLILLVICGSAPSIFVSAFAQIASPVRGDVRSSATGTWSTPATWERFDGNGWTRAVQSPDSSAGTITVRSGHAVTMTSPLIYDQLVVDQGGEVLISPGVAHTLADGPGTDLVVDGRWVNQGGTWTILGSAKWAVNDGGVYIHQTSSGISTPITKATLSRGSTFIYKGSSTLVPASTFSGRTYGNLSFESNSGAFTLSASGSGPLTVNGNLVIGLGAKWNTGGFSGNISVSGKTSVAGEWSGTGTGNLGVHTFTGGFVLESGGKYTLSTSGSAQGNIVFMTELSCFSQLVLPAGRTVDFTGPGRVNLNAPGGIVFSGGVITHCALTVLPQSILDVCAGKTVFLHGDLDLGGVVNGDSTSLIAVSDSCQAILNNGIIRIKTRFDPANGTKLVGGSGIWNSLVVQKGCRVEFFGSQTFVGPGNPIESLGEVGFRDGNVITLQGGTRQNVLPGSYSNLIIDNPSGVDLLGITTVNGKLSIRNGSLRTGTNSVLLGVSGILEETATSRVIGNVSVTRHLVSGTEEFFGDIGLAIRPEAQANGAVTVIRRTDTICYVSALHSGVRAFVVDALPSLGRISLTFQFNLEELNGAAPVRLQLYGSPDGRGRWNKLGGVADANRQRVTFSGQCPYSYLTLAEPFPEPRIRSVSPATIEQGSALTLQVSGSGFLYTPTIISIAGEGIVLGPVEVRSDSLISASLQVGLSATLGFRSIRIETAGGAVSLENAIEVLRRGNPQPILSSIAPATAARLVPAVITLHGGGFVEGLTTVSFGEAIETLTYVLDPTLIVVGMTIDCKASLGARAITVANPPPGGGSSALPSAFLVVNPPPLITSVSPRKVVRGEMTDIAIVGSNFMQGVTSVDCGDGITIHDLQAPAANLLKARVRVDRRVERGGRTVTVLNPEPGGGSALLRDALTITDPPPRAASIYPSVLERGKHSSATLMGSGFVPKGLVLSLGSGISIDSLSVSDSCMLKVYIDVSRTAPTGFRDLVLANRGPDGEASVLHQAVIVENPSPQFLSCEPSSAASGQGVQISVRGRGFFQDATSLSFGVGTAVTTIQCDSTGDCLTAILTVDDSASPGQRSMTLSNRPPGGGALELGGFFAIVNPVPVLNAVSPAAGGRGESKDLILKGANFKRGATSVSMNSGVTVDSVEICSPELLKVRITISPNAIIGARTIVVTNVPPGGGMAQLMHVFNVENATPGVDRVEPSIVIRGKRGRISLLGRRFSGAGTGVTISGGIAVESTIVASPTRIDLVVLVPAEVKAGSYDVLVSNSPPGGGECILKGVLQVHNPIPQFDAVCPDTAQSGGTLVLRIDGTGFVPGSTTLDAGDGITIESVVVKEMKTFEAKIVISESVMLGWRDLKVVNPGPGGGFAVLRNALFVAQGLVASSPRLISEKPEQTGLLGVFPNPFNSEMTVRFALSEPAYVTIDVHNILGVATDVLLNQLLPAGHHVARWHATSQPSGIYFLQLKVKAPRRSGLLISTRKIILLR